MATDVSSFVYFTPIMVFLVVFVIMVALLHKTKLIGENMYLNIFLSFVIATIFITASSVKQLVLNVIPWFALLLIALFLIMALIGFMGGKADSVISKGMGWVFVVLLILVFLVSGIKVFSNSISPYLPTATNSQVAGANPTLVYFFSWLYSPQVKGFFLLIAVAVFVTWFLWKTGGINPAKK